MLESNTSIKVLVIHVVIDRGESIKTKVLSVEGGAHKLSQGFMVRLDDFIMWTLIIKINGYKPVYPQMEDGRIYIPIISSWFDKVQIPVCSSRQKKSVRSEGIT